MTSKLSYVPSHPDLFQVDFRPGDYSSALIARKGFSEGEVIAHLSGLTKGPKAYSSVQCGAGPEDHVELHSDLLYVNHSCEPNVAFDLSSPDQSQWHVRALKRITPGDLLTFFYPSTEWLMDQPFDCTCGAPSCLRRVKGAAFLSEEELLTHSPINPWILAAVQRRDKVGRRS
ncbi:hypothetical protein BC834DRAFT_817486 [Gloeopeniophorella convolvens]|nr:hypothetical protein BC834DRAFT_817486 [Gloeopeniophorella convolvens]